MPPLAARVREYVTPTFPLGSDVVVIVSVGTCTVRVVPPATPPRVAEMVVEPALTPVASPEPVMVATEVLEDTHATWPVMFWVLQFE